MPEAEDSNRKGVPVVSIVKICAYCKKPIYSNEEIIDAAPLYFHGSHKKKEERVAIADMIDSTPRYKEGYQQPPKKEAERKVQAQPKTAASLSVGKEEHINNNPQPKKPSPVPGKETNQSDRPQPKKVQQITTEEKGNRAQETQPKKIQKVIAVEKEGKAQDTDPKKVNAATVVEQKQIEYDAAPASKADHNLTEKHEEKYKPDDIASKTTHNLVEKHEEKHKQDDGQYHYEPKAKKQNEFGFVFDYVLIVCGIIMALIGLLHAILGIISIVTTSNLNLYFVLEQIGLGVIIAYVGYRLYLYGRTEKESD